MNSLDFTEKSTKINYSIIKGSKKTLYRMLPVYFSKRDNEYFIHGLFLVNTKDNLKTSYNYIKVQPYDYISLKDCSLIVPSIYKLFSVSEYMQSISKSIRYYALIAFHDSDKINTNETEPVNIKNFTILKLGESDKIINFFNEKQKTDLKPSIKKLITTLNYYKDTYTNTIPLMNEIKKKSKKSYKYFGIN